MTPHAGLPPALPVFNESACPPFPKSSWPAWTTTVLPKIEFSPNRVANLSVLVPLATPLPLVLMLPKSPTCLVSSSGAPCVLPNGLKCGPADVHPFVLSPNWWMWNPLSALASLPSISHEMESGSEADDCSNDTTPLTLESPLKTATALTIL